MYQRYIVPAIMLLSLIGQSGRLSAEEAVVDYQLHVQPILTRYCAGCHNDQEKEGKFSASSFKSVSEGGEHGKLIVSGDAGKSRLIQLMTGQLKEKMPPIEEPQPKPAEVEILKQWIIAGAKAPEKDGGKSLKVEIAREVKSGVNIHPVTAYAVNSKGDIEASSHYKTVTLKIISNGKEEVKTVNDLPGKVTSLHFSKDDLWLVAGSGVPGLGGYAAIYTVPELKKVNEFRGHADVLYDAELSADKTVLATCSYDKNIMLWDTKTGGTLRELNGHNGAVYDLAFSPDGKYLVSGSADDTCKVWRVNDGFRLDTLPQPLKEVYCVAFTADGNRILCTGGDQKLRVYKFVSREKSEINPMELARFAHEKPILKFEFTNDGKYLMTIAEDLSVKLWETDHFTQVHSFPLLPEIAVTTAYSSRDRAFKVGMLNGKVLSLSLPEITRKGPDVVKNVPTHVDEIGQAGEMPSLGENEPNNIPAKAQAVTIPTKVTGVINDSGNEVDTDIFSFSAGEGEKIIFEVKADQMKSPLDSHLEVYTEKGERIERLQLQAVKDSYFTFRGKNDSIFNDFRVFNWEEMKLNQYLYANGEVVKLYLHPRGPDSGFNVYPGQGKRWGFFDTTPLAHALNEPCYIVETHQPGEKLTANGLPVFKLYYENDDESHRKLGRDSKLHFTASKSGKYLLKLKDVRGFEGENFKYELQIRRPAPGFAVKMNTPGIEAPAGGARELQFTVERKDQFEGPIVINAKNLPVGVNISTPIVIEENQIEAHAVIWLDKNVTEVSNDLFKKITFVAQADVQGKEVQQEFSGFKDIKVSKDPILGVTIFPAEMKKEDVKEGIQEITVHVGETKMVKLAVERGKFTGVIAFGTEGAGRNLPFGVYVDNIGLNGLLLLEDQNEREFFITADQASKPQSRLFHLKANTDNGSCSLPVMLHIIP